MPTLRNITACHKTGLSIKEKQAARACSFIFRQALIFLCLLPVMNCILISTHVTKKLIKKEEISRGEKETRKHSSINLKFLRKEKEGLRFKIRENITYTDYEVNQYKALYLCDKQVKKDNQGRMKFIVIGLAWVYEGTGKASYIKHLAIYSIFTLGIDMVISIGDWISLPFRLGSYEEEKVEKESFKSDQKQESRDIKDGEMVLVRDTSYYPVINSEVVIPESLLFYKRPIYYNSGKTNLVYKKDKSSKRKKYIRNN
ncbi:MAG: hypothetical protein KDK45_22855, partial [Leptospiraceae bacterium]|nr:hypothetical protein [Leptospiraceae bacterium]